MIDNSPRAIIDWQKRLAAKQAVYVVIGSDGEQTGNLYDSREAAQLEVDWLHARERRRYEVTVIGRLHDVQLSGERWT